jgi:hypothetical protein
VPADLALLAVSAALSLGLGVWRGQTIKVWRDADGTLWRQGSVLTLVPWGVLIVARGAAAHRGRGSPRTAAQPGSPGAPVRCRAGTRIIGESHTPPPQPRR